MRKIVISIAALIFACSAFIMLPSKEAKAEKTSFKPNTQICYHPGVSTVDYKGLYMPAIFELTVTSNTSGGADWATIKLENTNQHSDKSADWKVTAFKVVQNNNEVIKDIAALKNFKGAVFINPDNTCESTWCIDKILIGFQIIGNGKDGFKVIRDDNVTRGNPKTACILSAGLGWTNNYDESAKNNYLTFNTSGTEDIKSSVNHLKPGDQYNWLAEAGAKGRKVGTYNCSPKNGDGAVNSGACGGTAFGAGMYFKSYHNNSVVEAIYSPFFGLDTYVKINVNSIDAKASIDQTKDGGFPCKIKDDKTGKPKIWCIKDQSGNTGLNECNNFCLSFKDKCAKVPEISDVCPGDKACKSGIIGETTNGITVPNSGCVDVSKSSSSGNLTLKIDPKKVTRFVFKLDNPMKYNDIREVIVAIINWMLSIATLVALVFVIIGGYQYITSAGDAEKAKKATATLRNAVIGIVIIILSFLIISTVRGVLTGEDTTSTQTTNSQKTQK